MKKYIILFVVFSVMINLCACGQENIFDRKEEIYKKESEKTEPAVPTEEELLELELYAEILEYLECFTDSRYAFEGLDSTNSLEGINSFDMFSDHYQIYYNGYFETLDPEEYDEIRLNEYWYDGAKFLYDLLLRLENVDKWIGTEYAPEKSWKDVTDDFYILEDVLLSETEMDEHQGEFTEPDGYTAWWYNAKGQVSGIDVEGLTLHMLMDPDLFYYGLLFSGSRNYLLKYDLDRTLVQMYKYQNYNDSEPAETIDFYYNDDGMLTEVIHSENYPDYANETEFVFQYDEKNRLLEVVQNDGKCVCRYSYDETDMVTEIKLIYEWGDEYIYEYTYDELGKVIQVEEKYEEMRFNGHTTNLVEYENTWDIIYDAQGRVVECIYTDHYDNQCKYVVTYGDFYGYNPS